jgi:hypothetical protein
MRYVAMSAAMPRFVTRDSEWHAQLYARAYFPQRQRPEGTFHAARSDLMSAGRPLPGTN